MKKGKSPVSYGSSSDAAARAKLQKLKDATPDAENFKPGVLSPDLLALRMMAPPGPIPSSTVEPQQVLYGTNTTSSSPTSPSPLDDYLGTMNSQTLTVKGDLDTTNPSSPQNSNASTPKGADDPAATLGTTDAEPSAPNDSGRQRSGSNGSIAPRYSSKKSLPKPTIAHSSGHKKGRGTVLIPTRPGKKRRGSKANNLVVEEPNPSQTFQVELEQDGSMWVKVQPGGGRKQSMDSNASRASPSKGNKGKSPKREQQESRTLDEEVDEIFDEIIEDSGEDDEETKANTQKNASRHANWNRNSQEGTERRKIVSAGGIFSPPQLDLELGEDTSFLGSLYPTGFSSALFDDQKKSSASESLRSAPATSAPSTLPTMLFNPLQFDPLSLSSLQASLPLTSPSFASSPPGQTSLSKSSAQEPFFQAFESSSSPVSNTLASQAGSRRRKVRHVQIQTRKPAGGELGTQTDAEDVFEGAAKAANYDGVCQQLSKLETSHYQLMHENSRLRSEVVDYETESIRVQALLKEGKDKYDRLSVKSYRKIKELMTQKHILETELNTLRIQVQYLDAELTQQISRNGVA